MNFKTRNSWYFYCSIREERAKPIVVDKMKPVTVVTLFAVIVTNFLVNGQLRSYKLRPQVGFENNNKSVNRNIKKAIQVDMGRMKKNASKYLHPEGNVKLSLGALFKNLGARNIDPDFFVKNLPINPKKGD